MQVIKRDVPLEVFNEFKLEITVENKKDLMYLWLLFNMGTGYLEKAYEGDAKNLQRIYDLGDLDKGGIWQMLDNAKMAGEHILKLLEETSARIDDGDRWLICKPSQTKTWKFYVYEKKAYQRNTRTLIETEDEELACRILKGE